MNAKTAPTMRYVARFGTQTHAPAPASPIVHPNILTRRADTHLSRNGNEKEKRRGFAEAPPPAKAIISHHTHASVRGICTAILISPPQQREGPPERSADAHTAEEPLHVLCFYRFHSGFYALLNQIIMLEFAAFRSSSLSFISL